MSITGTRRRIAAGAVLCIVLAGSVATAPSADAITDAERRVFRMINNSRERRGIRPVRVDQTLSDRARRHSRRMADQNRLYHSCLECMVRDRDWRIVGENVAYGSALRGIHRAFMGSPPHRANILNSQFRRVGVGVVRRNGRYWVTQVFWG